MKKLINIFIFFIIIFCVIGKYSFAHESLTLGTVPDSSLTVNNGDTFAIILESNKTTGFSWQLTSLSDTNVVKFISMDYNEPQNGKLGEGGNEVWSFKAIGSGNTTIVLSYQRSWEKDIPPAKMKEYFIMVK